ncbi:MAG: MMPL family transporter [Candidatus Diapherotrites archaeon]
MTSSLQLLKSYRLWVLLLGIMAGIVCITIAGINFGIDFEGGTMFQIQLSEKVGGLTMESVANVVEKRLNWSGLQDVRVYSTSTGEANFIFVIVRNTDPKEIENITSLLTQQGRFEAKLGKDVIFTGTDIISIDVGTNAVRVQKISEKNYQWMLPFVLNMEAAQRFRDLTFHKCEPMIQAGNEIDYDCEYTYFFIDRPYDKVLVMSKQTFESDKALFLAGTEEIPTGTSIEEIIETIDTNIIIVDVNSQESVDAVLSKLTEALKEKKGVIVDPNIGEKIIEKIRDLNTNVKILYAKDDPWLYKASGIRSVVRLTPSVTGNKPYVERKEDMHPLTNLMITGSDRSYEEASQKREELKIILSSGTLPVSVESISTYSVSPIQGKDFLLQISVLAVIVLLVVSLVIFLRYKKPILAFAIIFTALVEVFLTTSFTSFLGQSLDIATLAGIIAIVGTGVNDQIIITDEILEGRSDEKKEDISLIRRAKRAFFIVVAAASTTAATMLPIIIFGNVLVKIVGFAVAVLIGVIVGVLITRPAYSEIIKYLV